MQYFLKNKFGIFKQISTLLFSHIIFFTFHKTNARLYKTKRAIKNPPAIAEGFLIFDYGSRRAAFALLQDDTQTTRV